MSSNENSHTGKNQSGQKRPGTTFTLLAFSSGVLLLGILLGGSLWALAGLVAGASIFLNRFLAVTWAKCPIATREGGDAELKVGDLYDAKLTIENTSRLPILWLLIEDVLPAWALIHDPPTLDVSGERMRVLLMRPKEKRVIRYRIRCRRRGYFQIGPTVLETGDLMGLYRRFRLGAAPNYLTVLPKTINMDGYDISSRRPLGEIRMRNNVLEDPTRLRGIRQWQPGDPMRRVHWSATARTGQLHSKVYEPTSIAGATIVLDFHTESNPLKHEPMRGDLAVTAAISIANTLHEQSQPFGLATNGRDAADRIRTEGWRGDHRVRELAKQSAEMMESSDRLRPIVMEAARGTLHLAQMRSTLARLERSDGMTLSQLLEECESRISSETTLMAIIQRATPDTIGSLVSLSRRGRAVAVVVNTHEPTDFASVAAPLIASNIQTMHLTDEESIRELCKGMYLRTV
ncbi:MAG: DUF58 domain-containing protein [Planctomycetota bacterium]